MCPTLYFFKIASVIALLGACSSNIPHQTTHLNIDMEKKTYAFTQKSPLNHPTFINTFYTDSAFYGHPTLQFNAYHLPANLYGNHYGPFYIPRPSVPHPLVFSTGFQDSRFQFNQANEIHPVSSSYRLSELLLLLKAIGEISSSQSQRQKQQRIQANEPQTDNNILQGNNTDYREGEISNAINSRVQPSCQVKKTHHTPCNNTQNSLLSILLGEYSNTNFFESNSSVIKPNRLDAITHLASFVAKQEHIHIEIRGHTDNTATDNHNQRLSMMRAKSIADRMIEQGVTKSQMVLFGYGRTKPICSNSNPLGKATNRRTEIYALGMSSDYFVRSCSLTAQQLH